MKTQRNYRLQFIDEESYQLLPPEIRENKLKYHRLDYNIKRREKRIQNTVQKIKELKRELSEWKKERTLLHSQLIEFHETFIPTVSISYSGKPKGDKKGEYGYSNKSWSITIRLKGRVKNIYLGTDKSVRTKLDEIFNTSEYSESTSKYVEQKRKVQSVCKKLIQHSIIEELQTEIETTGSVDEFLKRKKIKGMKYLKLR
jgi:hypothetical protein